MYVNVTRPSGPAMTSSMHAINHLDVNEVNKANEMLNKGYKPYIRSPFNVWSEVVQGEDGATNFMTGAGGFLQSIFNGFFGIRLHLDHLEIKRPTLPDKCRKLFANGFSYLNSKFTLKLAAKKVQITFTKLGDELMMMTDDAKETILIAENITCERH